MKCHRCGLVDGKHDARCEVSESKNWNRAIFADEWKLREESWNRNHQKSHSLPQG